MRKWKSKPFIFSFLTIGTMLAYPLSVWAQTGNAALNAAVSSQTSGLSENAFDESGLSESGKPDDGSSDNASSPDVSDSEDSSTVGKLEIEILPPSGWFYDKASVTVKIKGVEGMEISKIQARSDSAQWREITRSPTYEIVENGVVYVQVTDKAGNVFTASRYISCFDREAPVLTAQISGGLLQIKAEDGQSGVAGIYVDGKYYAQLVNGMLDIGVAEQTGRAMFAVTAVDQAGNKSNASVLRNPYYISEEDEQQKEQDTQKEEELRKKEEELKKQKQEQEKLEKENEEYRKLAERRKQELKEQEEAKKQAEEALKKQKEKLKEQEEALQKQKEEELKRQEELLQKQMDEELKRQEELLQKQREEELKRQEELLQKQKEELKRQEELLQKQKQEETPVYSAPVQEPSQPSVSPVVTETENEDIEEISVTPVDGGGTVLENSVKSGGEREFFTFEAEDGQVFYIVVDKEKSDNNVYLLVQAQKEDLQSLAVSEENGGQSESVPLEPVQKPVETQPVSPPAAALPEIVPVTETSPAISEASAAQEESAKTDTPEPEKASSNGLWLILLLGAAAVGGAAYYLKIYRPSQQLISESQELDGDEDEDFVIEDEEDDEDNGYDETNRYDEDDV